MSRRLLILLAALAALCVAAPAAGAVEPRASLGDLQDEVMCVSCNVVLNVAESPQADATRRQITALIDRGYTKQQIKDELVKEYGPQVLALPDTKGFNLAVYLVPILVALGLIGLVAFLIPVRPAFLRIRLPQAAYTAPASIAAPQPIGVPGGVAMQPIPTTNDSLSPEPTRSAARPPLSLRQGLLLAEQAAVGIRPGLLVSV